MNDTISQIESKLQTFLRTESCAVNDNVYGYSSKTSRTCSVCEKKNKAMIYMVGDILPLLSSLKYQTTSGGAPIEVIGPSGTIGQIESKLQLFLRTHSCDANEDVYGYDSQSSRTCSTCKAKNKAMIYMVGDVSALLSSLKYQGLPINLEKPVDTIGSATTVTMIDNATTVEALRDILQRLTNIKKKLEAYDAQECSYEDDKR